MKKIVVEKQIETVNFDNLTDLLEKEKNNLTIVYKAKSVDDYYCILKPQLNGNYSFGFQPPFVGTSGCTYESGTIQECVKKAINAGKEVFIFNKSELNQLFIF